MSDAELAPAPLPERIPAFLAWQRAGWPKLDEAIDTVGKVRTRQVRVGDRRLLIQSEPRPGGEQHREGRSGHGQRAPVFPLSGKPSAGGAGPRVRTGPGDPAEPGAESSIATWWSPTAITGRRTSSPGSAGCWTSPSPPARPPPRCTTARGPAPRLPSPPPPGGRRRPVAGRGLCPGSTGRREGPRRDDGPRRRVRRLERPRCRTGDPRPRRTAGIGSKRPFGPRSPELVTGPEEPQLNVIASVLGKTTGELLVLLFPAAPTGRPASSAATAS